MPLIDKYCASKSKAEECFSPEVPDCRQTLSRAPETEVGRGRQEIFMMGKNCDSEVWRMT